MYRVYNQVQITGYTQVQECQKTSSCHLSNIADAMSCHDENGPLVFIDNMTPDISLRMIFEVCWALLSAQSFTVQIDNDPEMTSNATQEFLKVKKISFNSLISAQRSTCFSY